MAVAPNEIKFTFKNNNSDLKSYNPAGEEVFCNIWILLVGRPGDPRTTNPADVPKWSYAKPTEYDRNRVVWQPVEENAEICPVGNSVDGGPVTTYKSGMWFSKITTIDADPFEIIIPGLVTSGRFYFLVETGLWNKDSIDQLQYFPQLINAPSQKYVAQPIQPSNKADQTKPDPKTGIPGTYYPANDPANWGYPVPDMTAPPWGYMGKWPNFADKIEFTITYHDMANLASPVQLWVNNTNVDNLSFPIHYSVFDKGGQQISPNPNGRGSYVGFSRQREALFGQLKTAFKSGEAAEKNFWNQALINGGLTEPDYGPLVVAPLSMMTPNQERVPSRFVRCVAPSKLIANVGYPDQDMQNYINFVWEHYSAVPPNDPLIYLADPPKGSNIRPAYQGQVANDAFVFCKLIKDPNTGVMKCSTLLGDTIKPVQKPTPLQVYGCDGPLQVGSDEHGSIIRQLSAALNRGTLPCLSSPIAGGCPNDTFAPPCSCGPPSNVEACFYARTIEDPSPFAYNFYSSEVHKAANVVTIGSQTIHAAYGFPYDDVCSISTTLSATRDVIGHVQVEFPKWN